MNFADMALFKQRFLSHNADADLNGDGIVNIFDLGVFKGLFGKPPGPSGLHGEAGPPQLKWTPDFRQ